MLMSPRQPNSKLPPTAFIEIGEMGLSRRSPKRPESSLARDFERVAENVRSARLEHEDIETVYLPYGLYAVAELSAQRCRVELRTLDDVTDPRSGIRTSRSYAVENGKPGAQRA